MRLYNPAPRTSPAVGFVVRSRMVGIGVLRTPFVGYVPTLHASASSGVQGYWVIGVLRTPLWRLSCARHLQGGVMGWRRGMVLSVNDYSQ